MVTINATYTGNLHSDAIHGPSGSTLSTDAPVDNEGLGETFSPTDLVATALGTCMLTIMGIIAKRREVDLSGATVKVEKHMISEPARRIGKLEVAFELPKSISEKDRQALERGAMHCPVHQSLHPAVEIPVTFNWVL